MPNDKAKALIGLAMRAGRCRCGTTAVEAAVRKGDGYLVIMDEAISDNSRKRYNNLCRHYNVPLYALESACAAAGRPGQMGMVLLDAGFAEGIRKEIESHQCGG